MLQSKRMRPHYASRHGGWSRCTTSFTTLTRSPGRTHPTRTHPHPTRTHPLNPTPLHPTTLDPIWALPPIPPHSLPRPTSPDLTNPSRTPTRSDPAHGGVPTRYSLLATRLPTLLRRRTSLAAHPRAFHSGDTGTHTTRRCPLLCGSRVQQLVSRHSAAGT